MRHSLGTINRELATSATPQEGMLFLDFAAESCFVMHNARRNKPDTLNKGGQR